MVKFLTAPRVNEPITGGKAVITGSRNLEEAHNLAVLLRSGALPVKVDIIETRTVGPTLGQDSKDKSVFAFTVGVGAIFVFYVTFLSCFWFNCKFKFNGLCSNFVICA